jgi:hypothetical protein
LTGQYSTLLAAKSTGQQTARVPYPAAKTGFSSRLVVTSGDSKAQNLYNFKNSNSDCLTTHVGNVNTHEGPSNICYKYINVLIYSFSVSKQQKIIVQYQV